eukprot:c20812_g3_i10.p2 GENE.c20812_g3_i10~~c20812_g3_i10.p2  ORF type:complete len:110 (-),score=15.18 c20812_g3_i10:652-981(-)
MGAGEMLDVSFSVMLGSVCSIRVDCRLEFTDVLLRPSHRWVMRLAIRNTLTIKIQNIRCVIQAPNNVSIITTFDSSKLIENTVMNTNHVQCLAILFDTIPSRRPPTCFQ